MSDDVPDYMPGPVAVYRRIRKAFSENRGVRLTAEEVDAVWTQDDSLVAAVEWADECDRERAGGEG